MWPFESPFQAGMLVCVLRVYGLLDPEKVDPISQRYCVVIRKKKQLGSVYATSDLEKKTKNYFVKQRVRIQCLDATLIYLEK